MWDSASGSAEVPEEEGTKQVSIIKEDAYLPVKDLVGRFLKPVLQLLAHRVSQECRKNVERMTEDWRERA